MVPYDDLTEEERAFRELLDRNPGAWERGETKRADRFSQWASGVRAAWARTPQGRRAIAEAPAKIGKKRRRVYTEEPGQP